MAKVATVPKDMHTLTPNLTIKTFGSSKRQSGSEKPVRYQKLESGL